MKRRQNFQIVYNIFNGQKHFSNGLYDSMYDLGSAVRSDLGHNGKLDGWTSDLVSDQTWDLLLDLISDLLWDWISNQILDWVKWLSGQRDRARYFEMLAHLKTAGRARNCTTSCCWWCINYLVAAARALLQRSWREGGRVRRGNAA